MEAVKPSKEALTNLNLAYERKVQRRVSDRDSDCNNDDCENDLKSSLAKNTNIESPLTQTKRFKSNLCDYENNYIASPVIAAAVCKIADKSLKTQNLNFQELSTTCALSPITEISNNLSDATLDTLNDPESVTSTEKSTPLKGRYINPHGMRKARNFKQMLMGNHDKDEISTKTTTLYKNVKQNEKYLKSKPPNESFKMPCNKTTTERDNSGRLGMDASLHEMAIDEFSFYDDDENNEAATSSSQEHSSLTTMGLLMPEGSPQRFQIIERPAISNKFLQPSVSQQKLQNVSTNDDGYNRTASSNTPAKSLRIFHSLSSDSMESMDDEYMELFEMEQLEQQDEHSAFSLNLPSDLNSLISGQIKSASASLTKTPEIRRPSVRRCLSMTENCQQIQPKTPELLKQVQETVTPTSTTPFRSRFASVEPSGVSMLNSCFKRPDPPTSSTCSPVQNKRHRCAEKENMEKDAATTVTRNPLRKSMSMNDAEIMSALSRSELIGDLSKPFALPMTKGRHPDLKSISSETVARLLRGEFDDKVASYKIIDCRYPYEYEGGHIRGAKNLYTQEQIIEEFLKNQKTEHQQQQQLVTACSGTGTGKHHIIIFHCEFSSERGPKLSRFLRNNDRARNNSTYPALDYPEIYLLHNGYKEFFETHAELCDPVAYRPMLEPAYNDAYRHFRAKSKSWSGEGVGGATSRLKKSRSRLLL